MITSFPTRPAYNPGGYTSFNFIPSIYITSFPGAENHVITSAITVSNPWLTGYSTYETLSFNEDTVKSGQGESYRPEVTGFVPGEYPELTELLHAMEQMKNFVLQITNNRGKIRIVGSPDMPLQFLSSFSSGDQRSSAKGYGLKFIGDTLSRAPFYEL
jgi:hypothetical protein